MLFNNFAPTSQKMSSISITEPSVLVLLRGVMAVYAENHKTHKYNLRAKRIFYNVKAYSAY
jgi:hypothetical protein